MLRGPRGESRPADAIGCAVKVARTATGEIEEELAEPAGRQRRGGQARAEKLTVQERSEIARKAAAARWNREPTIRYRRIGDSKPEED